MKILILVFDIWFLRLGLSYGNINRIIHDELKLKKLCARWVPHQLTEKYKQQRMEICQENLDKLESGQWHLCDIITGDEIWIYHRSIGSKQNNMTWCCEGASSATVVKRNQSDQKNMFVVFFRTTGSAFIHMIESQNSITGAYYKNNCLKPLFDNIPRQRPKSGSHVIKMHYDNGRVHQTKHIQNISSRARSNGNGSSTLFARSGAIRLLVI